MKKHTRILALLLALCMALSLAACSGNSGSSGSSSASGKTVVIGCQTDLVTLDPGKMYEPDANMISYAAYDMLYRVKPGTMGDPEPSVATGWPRPLLCAGSSRMLGSPPPAGTGLACAPAWVAAAPAMAAAKAPRMKSRRPLRPSANTVWTPA